MLKTRITEQYGLKVPFINAGMAFIATASLVRAVCKAGGMGMLGATAMPPDVLHAAFREIKAAGPACFGVNFIARFSGIEHIECASQKRRRLSCSFWMTRRTSGFTPAGGRQSHLVPSWQRG
jgi:enoyl-[acyl-carrier protein] reductase II